MIEINLIPDVKQELLRAQRVRSVVISSSIMTSIIAVGLVVLLATYIFGVQAARGIILDGQIKDKGQSLSKIDDLSKILTIQNQLSTISSLNEKKLITSRIFDVVSAITPTGASSVSFSQINVRPLLTDESGEEVTSGGGKIELDGQTASYEAMEVFKKRIASTSFEYKDGDETKTVQLASNISTGEISYGEDATGNKVLRFTISFMYAPELLSSKTAEQNIAYKLVVDGNVTDSYIGIPRFTERANDLNEGGQ